MRVPLKWLSDYVDLRLGADTLAHRLTMAGLEVTAIERSGGRWKGVVVGQVVEVSPHPNADRLRLATVEIPGERHTVVCGAPNVAAGQRIAFARLGAELVEGHTGKPMVLKKAKIRGVDSAGMVCSERELGLSDEHQGILVLDRDAPLGAELAEVLGDTVFEIDMKPNRADGLSILGVARDVAALTAAGPVREPPLDYAADSPPVASKVQVVTEDETLCSRYVATLLEGIGVGPSPRWMQERLGAAGMRPINNVVDVTNYVMLELGQPLHAFDYDTLVEGKIIVRRARAGEALTTLDGVHRTFRSGELLITDPRGPVAVAGVMGGLETEVTEKTSRVLLESATFDPVSIRRTAMALKAPSEASRRFAWGIPPELAPIASRRAMRLLLEAAGGRACAGVVDAHPAASPPVRAALPGRRLTQVLGVEIPAEKVVSTLRSLGFSVRVDPPGDYSVEVPYWRRDVRLADDIIEEVARVVGYDQIPAAGLEGRVPPRVPQPLRELRERTKDILVTAGMQEVITYPLVQRSTLESVIEPSVLASQEPLAVVNPLNAGEDRLRTSLRASILSVVAANQRHRDAQVAVFEASRIYLPRRGDLPREVEVLTGAVSGNRLDRWGQPSDEECDFFDMKACVDRLFERLGLEVRFRSGSEFGMVPGRTALLEVGNRRVGVAGQIDPRLAARFEVRRDVFLFEMALDEVLSVAAERRAYQPLSRFPPVVEDLAVVVRRELPAEEVRAAILRHPLVVAAVLFDEYEGAPVAAGRKSLAFSITYQASDRTLTEAEVGRARSTILEGLSRELDAELRS